MSEPGLLSDLLILFALYGNLKFPAIIMFSVLFGLVG